MDYIKRENILKKVFVFSVFLFFSYLQSEEFSAGRHYEILDSPTTTRDSHRIEVVEIFWFGCNHCFYFENFLEVWKEDLTEDVDFWKSHATWNPTLKTHARIFYTAKVLGVEEGVVAAAFNAIQRERRLLTGNSEIEHFFKGFGVDKEQYLAVSNSFGVNNSIRQADNRMRGWKVAAVPTLIVNGKYKVSATRELGTEKLLDVVDFLIKKEKRYLTKSD